MIGQRQVYCTYFDHRYLPRGLALYRSLVRHGGEFTLWVLCLDTETHDTLNQLDLPNLRPIPLEILEKANPALTQVKNQRSLVEYYFTLSPSLPLYVLDQDSQAELVTYLDADLYFFASPAAIFAELGDHSIAIIPHRFSERNKSLAEHGLYNVGWLTFRRDPQGLACLRRWQAQCLEWCFDRVEAGKYADQGYLNEWPEQWSNLVVLQHKGANLAPWNLDSDPVTIRDGQIRVAGDPLVFYHFQSLARVEPGRYKMNLSKYHTRLSTEARRLIYEPYARELEQIQAELKEAGGPSIPDARLRSAADTTVLTGWSGARLADWLRNTRHALKEQLSGEYFSVSEQ